MKLSRRDDLHSVILSILDAISISAASYTDLNRMFSIKNIVLNSISKRRSMIIFYPVAIIPSIFVGIEMHHCDLAILFAVSFKFSICNKVIAAQNDRHCTCVEYLSDRFPDKLHCLLNITKHNADIAHIHAF